MTRRRLAMVTGATSGIGAATSDLLARNGYDLVILGRRSPRLNQLKKSLEHEIAGAAVHSLPMDVSDLNALDLVFHQNRELFSRVDVLVNNAGLAKGVEPMHRVSLPDMNEMIDTNVKGLIAMSRLVIPFMEERREGHVVNIGSVAGRWLYPGGSVYCATKFAVRALSEGLRMDLLGKNIRVTNIEPGMVETEFSKVRLGDSEKAQRVYQGTRALTAKDIAESVLWCLNRPQHVNVQELVIFPTDQAAISLVHRRQERM